MPSDGESIVDGEGAEGDPLERQKHDQTAQSAGGSTTDTPRSIDTLVPEIALSNPDYPGKGGSIKGGVVDGGDEGGVHEGTAEELERKEEEKTKERNEMQDAGGEKE